MKSDSRFDALCAVAGPVSRETFDRLEAFETLFLKWAQRFNLVAPSTIQVLWERHIMDSAQLLPLGAGASNWLDLGSGGGFPGAIIAILLRDQPVAKVDLVESNGKKAGFLQTALAELNVSAHVHRRRIEECAGHIDGVNIVTARALAPLPRLLDLAYPWLSSGARGLFHKGRDHANEIEESRAHWHFDLVEHTDMVDRSAKVIEITGLRRRVA